MLVFLGYVFISFVHLYLDIWPFLLAKFSGSVRLDGHHGQTVTCLTPIHNCIKVWPLTGPFKFLVLNLSSVAAAVCLGSSSCLKVSLHPVSSFWQTEIRFLLGLRIHFALNPDQSLILFWWKASSQCDTTTTMLLSGTGALLVMGSVLPNVVPDSVLVSLYQRTYLSSMFVEFPMHYSVWIFHEWFFLLLLFHKAIVLCLE